MTMALIHGIKRKEEQQSQSDLDKSLSVLDEEVSRLKQSTYKSPIKAQEEKDAILREQMNKGIMTFDEYLNQSQNSYPDNRKNNPH